MKKKTKQGQEKSNNWLQRMSGSFSLHSAKISTGIILILWDNPNIIEVNNFPDLASFCDVFNKSD